MHGDRLPENLGHGVTVVDHGDGSLAVRSELLDLQWHSQSGSFPGSAVRWNGTVYEVVSSATGTEGARLYTLRPWVEGQVIRTLSTLNEQSLAEQVASHRDNDRTVLRRTLLVAAAPVTGLLPSPTQMRWQRELNFPAARATVISALFEMLIGAVGLVQAFTAGPGAMFLPPALQWLIIVGPIMFAESLIRLRFAITQGEGLGSVLLWPCTLVERHRHPPTATAAERPTVCVYAPTEGRLVLHSAGGRSDWIDGGVLRFRGGAYRLSHRLGRKTVVEYHFERVADDTVADLRLQPPRGADRPAKDERVIGPGTMFLRTTLMGFAPARYQRVFFRRYGSSPTSATVATACIELLGGAFNIVTRPATGLAGLADLFFLAEGVIRLLLAALRRAPVGSLLGLPFVALYRRWTLHRE